MRAGGEKRGNSRDRRIRKLWMLAAYGDGIKCPCVHCGCELDYASVEADRIIPGAQGGSYRRDNVQPSCRPCNSRRQNDESWIGPNPTGAVPSDVVIINPAFVFRGTVA